MEDLLIETLSEFGYPVRRQGSLLNDEPYPPHFFTFWNVSSEGYGFYDNMETKILYEYDVNFYSIDSEKIYEVLRKAKRKLRAKGFESWGDAHDVASDEPTHDGRGFSVSFLKEE